VYQAVYSPDGRRVATCANLQICLWEAATGKLLLTKDCSEAAPGYVRSIHWSPDGRTIASVDRQLRFWDSTTGKDLVTLSGHLANHSFYYHPRLGHVLICFPSAKSSKRVALVQWDPRSNQELARKRLGNISPRGLSPDGQRLVLEDGFRHFHLWDSKELRDLKVPDTWLVFGGLDDRHVAFSDGSTIGLWDSRTAKELWTSSAARLSGPSRYQFSPEGRYLYVSSWSAPQALRTRDGRLVRTYHLKDPQWMSDCQLSPDGRVLVCLVSESKDMVNQQFLSIEAATGQVRRRFAVPAAVRPWQIKLEGVAPDSTKFLSQGPGLSALVWDLVGQEEARRLGPPRREELRGLWQNLADGDAARAQRAIARLVVGGQAAQNFLASRLRPARPVDAARLKQLIEQLVDDDPAFRTKAQAALRDLDRQAEPALRRALQAAPARQLHEILERLLDEMDGLLGPGPVLRQVRAVEALEHLGAGKVLAELARGDPTDRLTQESQAALKRYTARRAGAGDAARPGPASAP
jgi:hypothetical protein